jgi:putative heme transporter
MAVSAGRAPTPWAMRAWALIVRWRRWIWLVLGLAGLLLAARAVAGSRAELFAGVKSLRQASWIWLGAAVVAEGGAFTALAFAQRRMLRAGGVNVSVGAGALARLAVASQAMGSVLPAGYLVSDVVVLRVLSRRGVSQLLALWMLAVAGLLYIVTLLLIGLAGAQLAPPGKNLPDLRTGAAIALGVVITVFVAVMAAARFRKHPWTIHELAARMPGGRLKRLIGGDVLANVSLGRRGWGASFGWMLLWWAGDMTCLAVAFLAVGGALPWRALLIAYAAGQLATLLPITPGGLGVTEGSMAVTLAAYGGGMAAAVAAVLLYRLITYWAVLPAGGLCYLSLRRRHSLVMPAPAVAHAMPAAQSTRLAGHAGAQEDQGKCANVTRR